MAYVVLKEDGETYQIRVGETDQVLVLGDVSLSGLSVNAAAEYFYALELVDRANNTVGRSKVAHAVERAIRSASENQATHFADVMVAVRWMMPDLAIPDEILSIIVHRIASENNVLLKR